MGVSRDLGIVRCAFDGTERHQLIRDTIYKDDDIAMAIYRVAGMETHNSVPKENLCRAIRWLFETYRLEKNDD